MWSKFVQNGPTWSTQVKLFNLIKSVHCLSQFIQLVLTQYQLIPLDPTSINLYPLNPTCSHLTPKWIHWNLLESTLVQLHSHLLPLDPNLIEPTQSCYHGAVHHGNNFGCTITRLVSVVVQCGPKWSNGVRCGLSWLNLVQCGPTLAQVVHLEHQQRFANALKKFDFRRNYKP